ncbi:MAG TPA: aminomethyl-transferring glycine dehydrogenase [Candidatus Polarisedimenticolaceae bacterium]|nr:aminomethyl-transferring glycine dehydrogenase [Candidatus Polarisedimenticolaceae bacterium]
MASTETRTERATAATRFADRHIGPRGEEIHRMLDALGVRSLDELIDQTVPGAIRSTAPLDLPPARSEAAVLADLAELAGRNRVLRSYLGMGYAATFTPPVIQRNVLENPGWYTQYTPYQAEIAQGRLEALLNFQTMVIDLTGLPVANASLLDEATAAAEAMTLCRRVAEGQGEGAVFFASERCHPQTLAVLETRAAPLGLRVVVGDHARWDFTTPTFGALVQYPATDGEIIDYAGFAERAHAAGALVVVAADLLALTLLRAPGEFGADVCVGNTQRFGVPLGFGGPHAAFMACREAHRRQMPGRIVGVSRDAQGRPALRLALSTREQHIRRDKATSNICTAQVLLAVMASMYAVWHGPEGLTSIARDLRRRTLRLAGALRELGLTVRHAEVFDTVRVSPGRRGAAAVLEEALARGINLRAFPDGDVGIALDETTGDDDLRDVLAAFGGDRLPEEGTPVEIPASLRRRSPFLTHPVFHAHRSETEMLRYLRRLEARDLSLTTSMIPLGSCTMKLNATAEMFPVSFPGFAQLHPFAPAEQAAGYRELFARLTRWLAEITGFSAVSLMPNAGSQGEYAGLLTIRAFHASRGEAHRDVCLIPVSAHGTNPASAVMAGLRVVPVACDAQGNVDLADLAAKIAAHAGRVAAMMLTYPSTYGVFEESVRAVIDAVHDAGGQVYLDGANMNALVGLCRPGDFGADVAHLNLHKTFCIPHGGGGPGMGPIGVAGHLAPFLPRHPLAEVGGSSGIGPVAAAPWGSPSILPISYAYIALMGPDGLRRATEVAILSANYVAARLAPHYPLLFSGRNGRVAHECIVDLKPLKASADVDADDVAKRLMDYGFHAPTMSWPVAGTLMIEPTESESKGELDRFCDAMIAIRGEADEIARGEADRAVNLLKMAPHTAEVVAADVWDRPYGRHRAAFPPGTAAGAKFWPAVSRIDNAYGDRNFVCACL